MEIYHYFTPKHLQEVKLGNDIVVETLKEFFSNYTNNSNINITYDYNYEGIVDPNIYNKKIKIIEDNLKILKKFKFPNDNYIRYDFEIDDYDKLLKIFFENELSVDNAYIGHCFDFIRYDYNKIFDLPLMYRENEKYFNRIFINLGLEKSKLCSLTLNFPVSLDAEEKKYLEIIEEKLHIKFGKNNFYLLTRNENTKKWKHIKIQIII
jgi:hypothetical protein